MSELELPDDWEPILDAEGRTVGGVGPAVSLAEWMASLEPDWRRARPGLFTEYPPGAVDVGLVWRQTQDTQDNIERCDKCLDLDGLHDINCPQTNK